MKKTEWFPAEKVPTKLCKDCKHYNDFWYLCERGRKQIGIDPIDGTPTYTYKTLESARGQRDSIMPWNCGKNGRHFEPKGKS
jgi:hypothetical protein